MKSLVLCAVAGSAVLAMGCAWAGPDLPRSSSRGGVVLGARVEKRCARCNHVVSTNAKAGDRCPYCGVVWGTETTTTRSSRPQSFASRGVVRSGPTVVATERPVSSSVSDRLRDLDAALNDQSEASLANILAVNFVLVGKDGRVQLDSERFLDTAITDAVANSLLRKSRILNSRVSDGEIVTTVRIYSKRYPADARPEYVTTYERQTWTTTGSVPRLRLIEAIEAPKNAKAR